MVYRHKRKQRLAMEMELGWFKPLHELIPEFGVRAVIGPAVSESTTAAQTSAEEKASGDAGFGRVGHEGLDAAPPPGSPAAPCRSARPLAAAEREAFPRDPAVPDQWWAMKDSNLQPPD